ncbi:hypothetical protein SpCBS45565_g04959 [Spizellomyces sp. 'palustris']|nr:hypothetical protein SpCBS45565_g04959 [Spizellomyces sp. 'palustris']
MPKRKHENPVVIHSESDSLSNWSSLDELPVAKAKTTPPSTNKAKQANSGDKKQQSFSLDEDEFLLDIVLEFQNKNGIGSSIPWTEVKKIYDTKFGRASQQLRARYRVLAKRFSKVTNGVEKNTKVEKSMEEVEEANY